MKRTRSRVVKGQCWRKEKRKDVAREEVKERLEYIHILERTVRREGSEVERKWWADVRM